MKSLTQRVDSFLDAHFLVAALAGALVFVVAHEASRRLRLAEGFETGRWVAIGGFLLFYVTVFYFHMHHVWTYLTQVALLGLVWGLWSVPMR